MPGADTWPSSLIPTIRRRQETARRVDLWRPRSACLKILFRRHSSLANEAAAQFIAEQWRQNLGITRVADMKPQQDAYAGSGPDRGADLPRRRFGTRVPDAASYLAGSIASTSSNAR